MKPIHFSPHARDQLADRGTNQAEVEETIRIGEQVEVRYGRLAFRKNFAYDQSWKGKMYSTKQVKPIVTEESDRLVIVTVYVYYFGEQH